MGRELWPWPCRSDFAISPGSEPWSWNMIAVTISPNSYIARLTGLQLGQHIRFQGGAISMLSNVCWQLELVPRYGWIGMNNPCIWHCTVYLRSLCLMTTGFACGNEWQKTRLQGGGLIVVPYGWLGFQDRPLTVSSRTERMTSCISPIYIPQVS